MSMRTSSPARPDGQQRHVTHLDRPNFTRRAFLKLAALGVAAGAVACAPIPKTPTVSWVSPTKPPRKPAPVGVLSDAAVTIIETEMLSTLSGYSMPGLALAVVKDGRLVFAKGYGVAERGTDRPVTPQSVFAWGGIAETMVTTAVMQLRSQGQVNLDAPVTQYLPYFKLDDRRYQDITLRHLLSCTSGLPLCVGEDLECKVRAGGEDTLEEQVRRLAPQKLTQAPGEKFALNHVGFEVLGDVIAKVSGQTFEAYMHAHLFAPLGMSQTTFSLCEVDPQWRVTPHVCRTGDTLKPVIADSRAHAPSGGLFSNLEDMTRYALMHLHRGTLDGIEILRADAYDEMWTDQIATPWAHIPAGQSEYRSRCLGCYSYLDRAGNRVVFSLGELEGFFTYLELVPQKATAVLFAGNRYGDSVDYYGDLEPTVSLVMDLVLGNSDRITRPAISPPRREGAVGRPGS
jgi:CubicO group peptidase (beta-lactamase class C family)